MEYIDIADLLNDLNLDIMKDIAVSPQGSLVVQNGDLAVVTGDQCIEQHIRWRILTRLGEWPLAPECGTRLYRFTGLPNSRETGRKIEMEVLSALIHDGFFSASDVSVQAAPVDTRSVAVIIIVNGMDEAYSFTIDLPTGEVSNWRRMEITATDI